MKIIVIIVALLILSTPVKAYQILMFSVSWCKYCTAFHNEVAPTYKDSEYSKDLPLIIINADDYPKHIPEWFANAYVKGDIKPIKGLPTFILWDEKRKVELDRLVGYYGKLWFYQKIEYKLYDLLNTDLHKPKKSLKHIRWGF